MPEFEEANNPNNQPLNYVPSTDAVKKPKTRRRSGGFKKEIASANNSNMGEISHNNSAKVERLSGDQHRTPEPVKAASDEERKTTIKAAKPVKAVEPAAVASPMAQPSEATQAAIIRIEKRLLQRRTDRDNKRAARKQERDNQADAPKGPSPRAHKQAQKLSLLGRITAFLKQLFGDSKQTVKKKHSGQRKRSASGQPAGRQRPAHNNRSQASGQRSRNRQGRGRPQNRSRKPRAQSQSGNSSD